MPRTGLPGGCGEDWIVPTSKPASHGDGCNCVHTPDSSFHGCSTYVQSSRFGWGGRVTTFSLVPTPLSLWIHTFSLSLHAYSLHRLHTLTASS